MQDYIDIAQKNGLILIDHGRCQCCGANTTGGIHECVEIFSLGFHRMDFSREENHRFRFLSVDAHTLQHPEIHGRWNNHFHLLRLHLIIVYEMEWNYQLSPELSNHLNQYKAKHQDEFLTPPETGQRGKTTTTDILSKSRTEVECRKMIEKWAYEVYEAWNQHHPLIDAIAKDFLNQ